MGASNSKVEEDKAMQLCHERKKFVKQALDGRCSLAATHVTYIQSLKTVGNALRRFVEPEAPMESSLYTSTSATPEPLAFVEKSLSQFSFSSPSMSQHVGVDLSPFPSPPNSRRYQAHHMKSGGSFSRKVEEKVSMPVMGSVTSSSTPRNITPRSADRPETFPFDTPPMPSETPPWDYFGLFHPIDNGFSSQEATGLNQRPETHAHLQGSREEGESPQMEDKEGNVSFPSKEEFQESEDEFDDPSTDKLVRSFENVNRAADPVPATTSPAMASVESVASETASLEREKSNSPDLLPLKATSSGVGGGVFASAEKHESGTDNIEENKVVPKDFVSSMKDIEYLFVKASECGREVPRMLEANKFHFRPIFSGKEGGSLAAMLLKSCFSCGDDPSQVQKEPAQPDTKYLTWHRTMSSRSSSFRKPPGSNTGENTEDLTDNLFDNFYMNAGSHASTLDRLFAWERKLYDEVKASEKVRADYDQKRKFLRELESNGESSIRIDKTRAVVKDMHSRIGVAIHRINSISRRIEDLRDKELQPQLEELIEGLRKMWEAMHECHKSQFHIISAAYGTAHVKISLQSDSHRQITVQLESELSSLSSSFTKWIGAQKTYVQALNGWLVKCVSIPQKTSKRNRRAPLPSLRNLGPPIYVTCGLWLDILETLPAKEVADSIKGLAAEIARFLPHQEKNQGRSTTQSNGDIGVNLLREEVSEDWVTAFDRLRSSLAGFLWQLNIFGESSVKMYTDLQKAIEERKTQMKNQL